MKKVLLAIHLFTSLSIISQHKINYNDVAQDLLQNIMDKKSYNKEVKILSASTLEELTSELKTDSQKIAFWINVYNAFIQISLTKNPKEYENKGAFFRKPRIQIANQLLSFDNIEHGILRKSSVKLSLGYLKKIFKPKWELDLRIQGEIDWRIHFALNCGAISCPPVAIYAPKDLNKALNFATKIFLETQTTYNLKNKTVKTTTLFSWFRGDFKGIKGIKKILIDYKIIPEMPNRLVFTNYDWTLSLANYRITPK
ncbi:MAG: DUF547 domain-containing protein [Polaribacter sp.]|jgi:hypothetical protein